MTQKLNLTSTPTDADRAIVGIGNKHRILTLDGVRGLAFTAVVAHHIGIAPVGWMGVDIFFVLSGFLITTILRARRAEASAYSHFYGNRVKRLLVPYLIFLGFCALFFTTIRWHLVWPYFVLPLGNYAATYQHFAVGPLSPIWSLAIEEQFYFIWPFIVLSRMRSTAIWFAFSIVVATPFVRLLATHHYPEYNAIYMLTPFRLDSICLGALLSLLVESGGSGVFSLLGGLVVMGFSVGMLGVMSLLGIYREVNSVLFNSVGYTLVGLVGVSLVIVALYAHGWARSLLVWSPLRWLGKISYMGYLIHAPMIQLFQRLGSAHGINAGRQMAVFSVPFSLLFAALSWRYIEKPIISLGRGSAMAK